MEMASSPIVGFISAPAWFDPAPSEFPDVVVEPVRTQQAPLLLPAFDYRLESIAAVQNELNHCALSLASMGCHLTAQVGSPFAWAGAASEADARSRCAAMTAAAGIPCLMTGLAIVDGLRALNVKKVALDCTYYEKPWRDAFARFLKRCGFDLVHASTMADQGLVSPTATMEDFGWSMTPELTRESIRRVADAATEAEAIVVTGAGTRTLVLLGELERRTGRPIVAADTVLYWSIARALGLTLRPVLGRLAGLNPIG